MYEPVLQSATTTAPTDYLSQLAADNSSLFPMEAKGVFGSVFDEGQPRDTTQPRLNLLILNTGATTKHACALVPKH